MILRCSTLIFLSVVASVFGAKPNVVVFLTDDQGWGDLSINGNVDLATPNIDSLARDGAQFERFYVSPVCSPTRAAFLTGRDHARSGVVSTSSGGERMALRESTIAEAFKAAGYRTGAFGKWHNGMQWPYHPNARGFDEFYGFCSGHWAHYYDAEMDHNGEIVRGKGFIVDDTTDKAMDFIEKSGDTPFFVYVPYCTPHSPMQVPDRFWNKFKDANLKPPVQKGKKKMESNHARAALAMCENIDWNVGRVMKKLDALGKAENTIVLYFSDNGPNGPRWNGAMKGRKGSTDEGGVRSPLIVRWPAAVKPNLRIPQIASAPDLLPTLIDVAGIERAGALPLDGVSLKPLLLQEKAVWPDRNLVQQWKGKVSVRSQRYRLDNFGKLFDMIADPGQLMPIQEKHPELTNSMKEIGRKWAEETKSPSAMGFPFPVGYLERPLTNLPARDGVEHGAVKRSNRFPNSSYFLDWKSADAKITWDLDVKTSGRYEVTLFYGCKAENIGCRVSLESTVGRTEKKITVAHDPPLLGPADDRSPRMESPMKDFKPINLGKLKLEKGRNTIALRASDLQGGRAIEVRRIMLRFVAGATKR